jgi:hypothetical protein
MATGILKLLIALAAATGIVINFLFWTGSEGRLNLFAYYTIQSNIIVALVFAAAGARALVSKTVGPRLALLERCSRVWITMTGLGFHFLLSRTYHPAGLLAVSNLLLHYIVPIGVVLAWLLLESKGSYRTRELGFWAAYPLAYAAFSLFRGSLDGFYPYWFINPTKAMPDGVGSWGGLAIAVGFLTLAFLTIGFALTAIDSLLARATRKKRVEAP